ncbi:MAG: adenylosuccinate synthetase [Actinomycetota bacterium]
MAVTVVVGGQYGSEGKGKLVAHLARTSPAPIAVARCGGTNSGHTVEYRGTPYPFRQLPSAAVVDGAALFLAAGMVIDIELLLKEMADVGLDRKRLHVDRNAVLLDERDVSRESDSRLRERVGSTLSGTGSATARKVLRDPTQKTAESALDLKAFITDVSKDLNELIDSGTAVIVEGTQGIGLSLHHSPHFPFATSRDTSAAAFLSEVGLAPALVSDVIVVFRTFPIRVAGNSGPLPSEMTWEELAHRAGSATPFSEFTTVTKKLRRVGEFDWDQAEDAIRINRPSCLALHGMDYISFSDRGARRLSDLSVESRRFVDRIEGRLGVPVHFIFTGPRNEDIIDLRAATPAVSLGQSSLVSSFQS